jgi:tRNA U34 2-thiouridine synthase MnmA/TrmU
LGFLPKPFTASQLTRRDLVCHFPAIALLAESSQMSEQKKAVALISGGLDSMLAAQIVQEQGVHVEGINFYTGFCVEGHTHAIRRKDRDKQKRNNALWVAEQLGIKLHIVDVVEPYKAVLLSPRHGYGANMNPCLDCKIFMVSRARKWIETKGFDFIVTGEVVGQRPMSQRRDTMPLVSRQSDADELLLRPLCARNLPPTLPERQGWVDRNRLYDISGRSRKRQMALAEEFGITDYAQPAGGCCFLTDASYSAKLRDLWASRGSRNYELDDIILLKVGRHLRPRPHFKIIVAREEGETRFLEGYRHRFPHIRTLSHAGPLTLLDGDGITDDDLHLAARIAARYSQGRDADTVEVSVTRQESGTANLEVTPLPPGEIEAGWTV